MGIHCWGEGLEKQTLAQGIINRSDFSTHIYQCFKLKFYPNSILTVLGNSRVSWFSNKQKGILSFFIKNALFPGTRPLHHLIYWVFHNKVNLVSSSTFFQSLRSTIPPNLLLFITKEVLLHRTPAPLLTHSSPSYQKSQLLTCFVQRVCVQSAAIHIFSWFCSSGLLRRAIIKMEFITKSTVPFTAGLHEQTICMSTRKYNFWWNKCFK